MNFAEKQGDLKAQILSFIVESLGITDNEEELHIASIEENCGSMWVTLSDGTTQSISIFETEPDENL
jgi:hypothetical protein